jgi:surface antigen
MRTRLVKLLLVLPLLAIAPAAAFNTFFMDKMPIGHMNKEDIDILTAATNAALDTLPDGGTVHWSNQKTGANGDLTPRATYQEGGRPCRDMQFENSAGGFSNRTVLSLCKQPDGEWKIVQ